MAIDLFVIYGSVAFLLLSGTGLLHVEEADVFRVGYRHTHALDRRGSLESIGESSGTLAILRRRYR